MTINERPYPQFVLLGTLLIAVVTIASIVTSFFTLDIITAEWANSKSIAPDSTHYAFLKNSTYIGGVVIVVMKMFFCWLILRRQNWARMVILILSMLSLLTLPFKLETMFRQSFTLGLWYSLLFMATAAGLACLFAPISNRWFRSIK